MNVKRRTILMALPLILTSLCLIITPIHATKPLDKLVIHEVSEQPFNGGWAKTVMGGTMIIKNQDGEIYEVTSHMIQKLLIYDYEGGRLMGCASINLNYAGSIKGLNGENPTDNLWTGKLVVTLIVNWFEGEAPLENSHWVVWYEVGEPIKANGFGTMPF